LLNHLKFEDSVVEMQELSLLQFSHRSGNEIVVSLHLMVSEWLRMRLDKNLQLTSLTTAVSHLERYVGSMGHSDYTTRKRHNRI